MNQFIHLKTHSDFSIATGSDNIKSILQKTKNLNMPAIALTDCNNIFGIIKFYKLARSYGIKPIMGVDFKYNDNIFYNKFFNITALIINDEGYYNIKNILSLGYLYRYKKFYIDNHLLLKFKKGLIILSGGMDSDIAKAIIYDDEFILKKKIKFWKENFNNNYYLEINRINKNHEEKYIKKAISLSIKYNIPLVATNNICFVEKEDYEVNKITTLINSREKKTYIKKTKEQYLKSTKEMLKLFQDIPESLINSVQIAKRCNLTIEIRKRFYLPRCYDKEGKSSYELLVIETRKGLKKRLNQKYLIQHKEYLYEYIRRLAMELKTIKELGFSSYFLIVKELIQWAKSKDIPVGPGRGSGAGSLVAFALEITEIDPLKYDLLFERFLNPEKQSMPDFDIDFCMKRRDEIINHIIKLYGIKSIAQIITFGTLGAKGSIRNAGRILGYPYKFVDKLVKLFPKDPELTIKEILQNNNILRGEYKKDDYIKNLIDTSIKIEGSIKNIGKHAGGVIITPSKITNFTSLYYNENYKIPITQFDKYDLEEIGLVKFDFLGLTTLSMINYCVNLINNKYKDLDDFVPININEIDLNDEKCFNELHNLESSTLFQLESVGIKTLIRDIKPKNFDDLSAVLALYRPGPLGAGVVQQYVDRKQGKEPIYYPDPDFHHEILIPILSNTYGIIIYQEQIMKITQTIAGYSLGESDLFRRLMGKKDIEAIKKQGASFIKRACKLGYEISFCQKLYELIEKLAGYGFNKSHSSSYALLTYQTLWLKTYHPSEFMAANLSVNMHDTEQIISLLYECKSLNIKILPPNINISMDKFTTNRKGDIIYGLSAIKGLTKNIIKIIIKERTKSGNYRDLYDFFKRIIYSHTCTLHIIKIIIFSGCLDIFYKNRATLLYESNIYCKYLNEYLYVDKNKQKKSIFLPEDEVSILKRTILNKKLFLTKTFLIEKEYECFGLYFQNTPFKRYKNELLFYNNAFNLNVLDKLVFQIIGLIITYQQKITATGFKYYIFTIDDQISIKNIIINIKTYTENEVLLTQKNILIFKIKKIQKYNTDMLIVEEVMSLIKARELHAKYVKLKILIEEYNQPNFMEKLDEIIKKYKNGKLKLIKELVYNNKESKLIDDKTNIYPSEEFFDEISILFTSYTRISVVC